MDVKTKYKDVKAQYEDVKAKYIDVKAIIRMSKQNEI